MLVLLQQLGDLSDAGRWLPVGSVALALAANVALTRTLEARRRYRAIAVATSSAIVLILLVGVTSLDSKGVLAVVTALLLASIVTSIVVWLRTVDSPSTVE